MTYWTVVVSLLLLAHSALAQSPDGSVTKAFGDCLLREGQSGSYVSTDGGHSALLLVGQCRAQWEVWVNECVANGGTDSDCTVKSMILSQGALKILGK